MHIHRICRPSQTELTALEPVLIVKTEETAQLLQQLAIEQAEVERVRSRVEVEEATVKRQAEAVAELQAGAQTEVEEAMPILENAIRALDALDKKVLPSFHHLAALLFPVPAHFVTV